MKVNSAKTQMLCISASKNNEVTSYIRTDRNEIRSGEGLKILGFNFDKRPNAAHHVTIVINKLYGKLWTLRFLKRSKMAPSNLLKVYKEVLRTSAEYSSVVYGSLIPEYLSEKLESVQKQALKIIFGHDVDYDELVTNGTIETLKDRREQALLRFALKAASSDRFGPAWFTENKEARDLRASTMSKYVEKHYSTERGRNNPISVMTRKLNEHYRT